VSIILHSSPIRAVRMREVSNLTGFSPATVWRKVKQDPEFPRPYKLSPGVTVWDEAEILSWIVGKKSERGA
jgi:predicted DNA-binding transcriptional regulator AlpA